MKKSLTFELDSTGDWYVVLPEWEGAPSDLQMVLGADTMLTMLSSGEQEVEIFFSTDPYEGANVLSWQKDGEEYMTGAYYRLNHYNGIFFGHDLWLCDVTKYVFGEFPKFIYFSVLE